MKSQSLQIRVKCLRPHYKYFLITLSPKLICPCYYLWLMSPASPSEGGMSWPLPSDISGMWWPRLSWCMWPWHHHHWRDGGLRSQAVDAALMSKDFRQLQHLMNLTTAYLLRKVQGPAFCFLLLLFSPSETDYVKYARLLSPITIGDTPIQFVDTAEHVGVLRSVSSPPSPENSEP